MKENIINFPMNKLNRQIYVPSQIKNICYLLKWGNMDYNWIFK